jgi:ABC-2 type transport system ATP-binding protein
VLELEHLTKRYGRAMAVEDLNLSIAPGEIFGFIGPNGAGKTTTIRMAAGLLAPSAGRVRVGGIDMQREPERAKRLIGLVPDRPYLYEKLTGREFLRFTADVYGVPGAAFARRAARLLEIFSLSERSDELIEAYSHGMKQRLIMAAALLHEPPLLVVDEPMVGLDPRGIKRVRDLFRELSAGGTAIFMSTHTLSLAEDLCRRIGIIHRGRLLATGSMEELTRDARLEREGLEAVFLQLTREAEVEGAP